MKKNETFAATDHPEPVLDFVRRARERLTTVAPASISARQAAPESLSGSTLSAQKCSRSEPPMKPATISLMSVVSTAANVNDGPLLWVVLMAVAYVRREAATPDV